MKSELFRHRTTVPWYAEAFCNSATLITWMPWRHNFHAGWCISSLKQFLRQHFTDTRMISSFSHDFFVHQISPPATLGSQDSLRTISFNKASIYNQYEAFGAEFLIFRQITPDYLWKVWSWACRIFLIMTRNMLSNLNAISLYNF